MHIYKTPTLVKECLWFWSSRDCSSNTLWIEMRRIKSYAYMIQNIFCFPQQLFPMQKLTLTLPQSAIDIAEWAHIPLDKLADLHLRTDDWHLLIAVFSAWGNPEKPVIFYFTNGEDSLINTLSSSKSRPKRLREGRKGFLFFIFIMKISFQNLATLLLSFRNLSHLSE